MALKIFGFNISRGNQTVEEKKDVEEKKEVVTLTPEEQAQIIIEALEKKELSFSSSEETVEMPVGAGRSSVPESANTFVPNSLTPISIDFPFNLLPMVENMQVFNRHISYSVENILTLGSTKHHVKFSDDVSDDLKAEMQMHLDKVSGSWYEFSDGVNSLINDLFVQLATFGCISAERIPKEDLSGIKKIVRVSPVNIRFTYNRDEDYFSPIQRNVGINSLQHNILGYTELNPTTYSYMAMKRYKTSPIATPPFFSAIEDICTENDMLKSFKNMMKRIGMLGFLSVLVSAPTQIDGEDPSTYRNRVDNYLNDVVVPQAERQFSKGVAVGYKGAAEFKVEGNNMNVQGADGLMSIMKKLVFAGMKQDPSMHGEQFNTTEAFARVILGKLSKQINNYQSVVASFLETCYLQELVLAGFNPGTVTVEFEQPMVSDKLKHIQAENTKFDLKKKEYDQGLINQTDFAQAMGYQSPAEETPRTPQETVEQDDEEIEEDLEELKKKIKSNYPNFDYYVPEEEYTNDGTFANSTDFGNEFANKNTRKYISEVLKAYNKAVNNSSKKLKGFVADFNESTSQDQVKEYVQRAIFTDWKENFTDKIEPITNKYVQNIYAHFRSDKSVFKDARGFSKKESFFDIPDSIFDVVDFSAIEYLQTVDNVWLGKFITDEDTIERINKWVEKSFEKGEVPVANNQNTERFIQSFQETVGLESWKMRRIIETTVNKARSYSSVLYINQAGVQKYENVAIIDERTCGWCRHMDGKILEVSIAVDSISRLVSRPVEDLPTITPFATTIKLNEFQGMDSSALQAAGINLPSYHPHCRDRVIAVL